MKRFSNKLRGLVYAFAILCLPSLLFAQNITVKGKVTDASTGKPIESATISPKNSRKGTVTGVSGEFSLAMPKGEISRFAFVGLERKALAATASFGHNG